jgi:hypothetical protein
MSRQLVVTFLRDDAEPIIRPAANGEAAAQLICNLVELHGPMRPGDTLVVSLQEQ